jgi:hypothetical protein
MKRHFWGIGLYTLIVSVSIGVYVYLRVPKPLPIRKVSVEQTRMEEALTAVEEGSEFEDLTCEIESAVADMATGTAKARLKLRWLGVGPAPESVRVRLHFFTPITNGKGFIALEPVKLDAPFHDGNAKLVEIETDRESLSNMPRNLYAQVNVWPADKPEHAVSQGLSKPKSVLVRERK